MIIAELHARDISCSASGALIGTLYLELGDRCFPDAAWSDFAVVVLEWWCSALERLHQGESGPITVHFMDGPYRVELESLDEGRLDVTLLMSGARHDQEIDRAMIDRNQLTHSVIAAARAALRQCRERGWSSRDIEALSDSLNVLVTSKRFGSA
jgi:hypothetical protein